MKLTKLDYKNLEYGIYNVKVTTDDKNPLSVHAKKVFAFNSRNYYTHYCLQFCYEYQDMFGFKMELLQENKYNAYVYDKKDLAYSATVFEDWFKYLSKIKAQFPDNPLVKYLFSSLHGTLETARKLYFTDDDLNNDELDIKHKDTFIQDQEKTKYVIIDTEGYYDEDNNLQSTEIAVDTSNPYFYNMARLKPFLTSYGRAFMGKLIIKENLLESVLRVHTDSITLSHEYDFTKGKEFSFDKRNTYFPKPEAKSTGVITWYSLCKYDVYEQKREDKKSKAPRRPTN